MTKEEFVKQIEGMSVVELNELVKALEEKLYLPIETFKEF